MTTGVLLSEQNLIYSLGDKIELLLQMDNIVDDKIPVSICDVFNNKIADLVANRLTGNVFSVEWVIPVGLRDLYNINKEEDNDVIHFRLNDQWDFGNGNILTFPFKVFKELELPITDNSIIQIHIDGLS